MREIELELNQKKQSGFTNSVTSMPIKHSYKDENYINENNFNSYYDDAIVLMGGDRLLRPKNSSISIRKTSTQGVYKVLVKTSTGTDIKILDEAQLFDNKRFAKATISKLSATEYEITSFDEYDNMEINHYSKNEAIKFINNNRLEF